MSNEYFEDGFNSGYNKAFADYIDANFDSNTPEKEILKGIEKTFGASQDKAKRLLKAYKDSLAIK